MNPKNNKTEKNIKEKEEDSEPEEEDKDLEPEEELPEEEIKNNLPLLPPNNNKNELFDKRKIKKIFEYLYIECINYLIKNSYSILIVTY